MARKKSKGSKKSRAKKARKSKKSAPAPATESVESDLATDENAADPAGPDSAPSDDAPPSTSAPSAEDKPAAEEKSGKKKAPKKKASKKKSSSKKDSSSRKEASDEKPGKKTPRKKASGKAPATEETSAKKKSAKKKSGKSTSTKKKSGKTDTPPKKGGARKKPEPEPVDIAEPEEELPEVLSLDDDPPEVIKLDDGEPGDRDDADIEVIDLDADGGDVEVIDLDADEGDIEVIDLDDDEGDIEVIDLDDDDADLDALVAAAGGEAEPVSIDLDEELDDPEARRRLIEEALAFVEAEESGEASAAADPVPDDAHDGEEPAAAADDSAGASGGEAHSGESEGIDEPQDDAPSNEERPLIGAEALLALSEIRAEGIASLPEELILDLGDASTPEERDRLLAAAMAHAEMQEAIYRIPGEERRSRRIKAGIAATVVLIAAILAVSPPGLIVPTAPPALTEADREQGVLVALTIQAQQVEAFRVANGRLPRTIAEIDGGIPGIRLVRSSNRLYQLIAYAPSGEPIVYDSSAPSPAFERLWRTWSTTDDDDFGGLR